jgi:hypothetical protein
MPTDHASHAGRGLDLWHAARASRGAFARSCQCLDHLPQLPNTAAPQMQITCNSIFAAFAHNLLMQPACILGMLGKTKKKPEKPKNFQDSRNDSGMS